MRTPVRLGFGTLRVDDLDSRGRFRHLGLQFGSAKFCDHLAAPDCTATIDGDALQVSADAGEDVDRLIRRQFARQLDRTFQGLDTTFTRFDCARTGIAPHTRKTTTLLLSLLIPPAFRVVRIREMEPACAFA